MSSERLRIVAGSLPIAEAEVQDRSHFARMLEASVPEGWPPETVAEALVFFRDLYKAHPGWVGWLSWYAIRVRPGAPVLCGSVGFKGPPDAGMIEIGYSVLPRYQNAGIATEMVGAMLDWALSQVGVRFIEAETTPDNIPSIRVLESNRFLCIGDGKEPGSLRYRRDASQLPVR